MGSVKKTKLGSDDASLHLTCSGSEYSEYSAIVDRHEGQEPRHRREEKRHLNPSQEEECVYCTPSHPKANLTLYIATYIVFMLFGACLFTFIESPLEMEMRDKLMRKQRAFLAKHQCVDAEALNDLLESVVNAHQRGIDIEPFLNQAPDPLLKHSAPAPGPALDRAPSVSPSGKWNPGGPVPGQPRIVRSIERLLSSNGGKSGDKQEVESEINLRATYIGNEVPPVLREPQASERQASFWNKTEAQPTNWEFTSSLLFVTSIVTTIGYGHVTPLTAYGKVACMVFSGVGIPATLTLLSTLVALLVRGPVKFLESVLSHLLSKACRNASLFALRFLHLMIVTSIVLCFCFLIPASVFSYLEADWTFLDALYYCYISLTTIGLGDFIPSVKTDSQQALYRFATICYLYFGLTMMMLWLALIYRIPQFDLNKLLISDESPLQPNANKELLKVSHNNPNNNSKLSENKQTNYGTQQVDPKSVP